MAYIMTQVMHTRVVDVVLPWKQRVFPLYHLFLSYNNFCISPIAQKREQQLPKSMRKTWIDRNYWPQLRRAPKNIKYS